jgi:hypothetical protein
MKKMRCLLHHVIFRWCREAYTSSELCLSRPLVGRRLPDLAWVVLIFARMIRGGRDFGRQYSPNNLRHKVLICSADKVEGKRLRVCGKLTAVPMVAHNRSATP